MAITDFPSDLQEIIQQNQLEKRFIDGLESKLAYRSIAEQESFPTNIGETLTKTKNGLMDPVTTPLDPRTNTNLDNGITPNYWAVEQYTMALNMYGNTTDLNVVTQKVGIKERFLKNANLMGINARQTLDRVARNTLFDTYMGGNTRVTVTLGAPSNTINVDDIRGFITTVVNPTGNLPGSGTVQPVSPSNPLPVVIGSNVYSVVGYTIDATNATTAFRGISGTLTLSANVTVLDGTLGNAVVSTFAPLILRPNGKATTRDLIVTDTLTMSLVLDAVTELRNNNVPDFDGRYHMFLDNRSARQLFADPEFQLLYRGTGDTTDAYKNADVVELLDVRFMRTTEAPQQNLVNASANNIKVHRPYICGQGSLIEGNFAGLTDTLQGMGDNESSEIVVKDGVAMVVRPPLDRFKQIIAQSWYAINGYTVPTDVTATTTIIPTASQSYFKRGLLLEVASA